MEPPSSARVSVINRSGVRLPTSQIKKAVEICFAKSNLRGEVSVLLTDDEGIQALNKVYRNLNEPTDVLTFPALRVPGGRVRPIGDIAISVPYAKRQAEARGIGHSEELQFLAIHGALHLLGWNDETDAQREQMFAEMDRIGRLAGLPPEPEWCSLLHERSQC
jgi:rRNA maturation RNase YbeY